MVKDWITWQVFEHYSDDLRNQLYFLYSSKLGWWKYGTIGNWKTGLMRLPVWLFDCHLKKNEVSYNLGCGKHQFYLTPENFQVHNLRANWFWKQVCLGLPAFETLSLLKLVHLKISKITNNQTLVLCVNNHNLYGKVVKMPYIFFLFQVLW